MRTREFVNVPQEESRFHDERPRKGMGPDGNCYPPRGESSADHIAETRNHEQISPQPLPLQPERLYDFFIHLRGLAVFFPDNTKAPAIVPHCPADPIRFKRRPHVTNPIHP